MDLQPIYLLILIAYNALVVFVFSKYVSRRFGIYPARKFIHIYSAGVTAPLMPLLFDSYVYPVLSGILATLITVRGHEKGGMRWFQVEENMADVYFCLMYTALFAALWDVNRIVAVLSALYLSVGDGVTGVVRSILHGRRTKAIEGNIAMLVVCSPLGYFLLGVAGLAGAVAASLVERFEGIDDNISIPITSSLIMLLLLRLA